MTVAPVCKALRQRFAQVTAEAPSKHHQNTPFCSCQSASKMQMPHEAAVLWAVRVRACVWCNEVFIKGTRKGATHIWHLFIDNFPRYKRLIYRRTVKTSVHLTVSVHNSYSFAVKRVCGKGHVSIHTSRVMGVYMAWLHISSMKEGASRQNQRERL